MRRDRDEKAVAAENEAYYRRLVEIAEQKASEIEADITSTRDYDTLRDWESQIQGHNAHLALALYAQGKIDEAREAAKRAMPVWRDRFLPRLESVAKALLEIDKTDCECLPDVELHQKFSIEVYDNIFLLRCVACDACHARSELPEFLSKIQNKRVELAGNTDIKKSFRDDATL